MAEVVATATLEGHACGHVFPLLYGIMEASRSRGPARPAIGWDATTWLYDERSHSRSFQTAVARADPEAVLRRYRRQHPQPDTHTGRRFIPKIGKASFRPPPGFDGICQNLEQVQGLRSRSGVHPHGFNDWGSVWQVLFAASFRAGQKTTIPFKQGSGRAILYTAALSGVPFGNTRAPFHRPVSTRSSSVSRQRASITATAFGIGRSEAWTR